MGSLSTFAPAYNTPQFLENGTGKNDKFGETFQDVLDFVSGQLSEITSDTAAMQDSLDWLTTVLKYNVPHGKQLRGRMVEQTYKLLAVNVTEENLRLARILGWIVEILQAACLIADDIMDEGITRRGKPCWHRVNKMGNMAFNDTLLLEHYALQLLRIHFGKLDTYTDLVDLIHGVIFKTALGQSLDLRKGQNRNFEQYSKSLYQAIVAYKTAYYTIYFPVALAMTFAGISAKKSANQQLWKGVMEASLKIGTLFQIQDDYFDCYADELELGKVGKEDIEMGKCTWLLVSAIEKCSYDELQELLDNYGWDDMAKVTKVKNVYDKLHLPELFAQNRQNYYNESINIIGGIDHLGLQSAFMLLLDKIFNRSF